MISFCRGSASSYLETPGALDPSIRRGAITKRDDAPGGIMRLRVHPDGFKALGGIRTHGWRVGGGISASLQSNCDRAIG